MILLVDDDRPLLESLGALMENEGYRVLLAISGSEALALCQTTREIALIVCDLNLGPDMSGIDLLKIVRSHRPDMAFILISGQLSVAGLSEAIKLGSFRYLRKPIDPDHFLTLVAGLVFPVQ